MKNDAAISFIIPGQPVAKGRPRFARRGAHVVAYTPGKTASYENMVKLAATQAMAGRVPIAGPVQLTVALALQVPASWSTKRRALALSGAIRATKKPDADNVLKGIKDGCNSIVWCDDAQVVRIILSKDYGEIPGAVVTVLEIDGEPA